MKTNTIKSILLLSSFVTFQAIASTPPFSYDGWSVTNGNIDLYASPDSVCASFEYDCSTIVSGNGFKQVQVAPVAIINTVASGKSYLMTIITNENATGMPNVDLDFYQVNTSSLSLPFQTTSPIISSTHSERYGIPAYFRFYHDTDKTQVYRGEIKGVLNYQSTPTGEKIALSEPQNYTIKFLYHPNTTPRINNKINNDNSETVAFLSPAISSLEVIIDDNIHGKDGFGHINGDGYSVNYDLNYYSYETFLLTAYAATVSIANKNTLANKDLLYGIDFFAFDEKSGTGARPVLHYLTNPPSREDFTQMGLSLYFNEGAKILSGSPTSFTLELVSKSINIVAADAPVKPLRIKYLHDSDLATFWNNDGNRATAWFDVMLDGSQTIKALRLAPRVNRAYTFNTYVDQVFVGQYTTASTPSVELQTFPLPAGTTGSTIRVESASHNWFKVHEVELYNGEPTIDTCGSELAISDVTVPARELRKKRLIDDDLSTTSFWVNKSETWFELSLNSERQIKCLQLAPKENRAYTFDVYVDNNFVAQYTTESANTVALQNFTLPAGIRGTNVRIEVVSHNWLKVHEAKLQGE